MSNARNLANVISGNYDIPAGSLDNAVPADGSITVAKLSATGTPSASTFLSGAGTWAAPGGGFSNMQVFTSSGTFTVPSGVTKVKVTVVGGGGAGGGGWTSNSGGLSVTPGAGGGGGGAAVKVVSGLSAGGTVAVTVGGSGGTSSFGAYCSATGGASGTSASGSSSYRAGGAGGAGSSGDINFSGQPGRYAASGTSSDSGDGGDSLLGSGGPAVKAATPANGFTTSASGLQGSGYGGGSSGSFIYTTISNTFSLAGVAGASGVVIVEY